MKWFNQLRQDPIGTIADWQDMRWPWILMAAVCVLLVLVAHYMFQVWLYMTLVNSACTSGSVFL